MFYLLDASAILLGLLLSTCLLLLFCTAASLENADLLLDTAPGFQGGGSIDISDAPRGYRAATAGGVESPPYQGVLRPHLPASPFSARPAQVAVGPCLLRVQVEWWTQLTDAWAGLIRE